MESIRSIINHLKDNIDSIDFSPSLTKQSFKEECDINHIMNKYQQTGHLTDPNIKGRNPQFGDFTKNLNIHDANQLIIEAKSNFFTLPSSIRKRFKNNPLEFMRFFDDPTNKTEAIELGLIPAEKQKEPVVKSPEKLSEAKS